MKKIVFLLVVGSLTFTSCGGGAKSAAEIKVADIKDACGCLEAMNVVADEVLAAIKPFETEDELEKDEAAMKSVDALENKFGEIEDHCRKELKLEKKQVEECNGFADFDAKMDKIEKML